MLKFSDLIRHTTVYPNLLSYVFAHFFIKISEQIKKCAASHTPKNAWLNAATHFHIISMVYEIKPALLPSTNILIISYSNVLQ